MMECKSSMSISMDQLTVILQYPSYKLSIFFISLFVALNYCSLWWLFFTDFFLFNSSFRFAYVDHLFLLSANWLIAASDFILALFTILDIFLLGPVWGVVFVIEFLDLGLGYSCCNFLIGNTSTNSWIC